MITDIWTRNKFHLLVWSAHRAPNNVKPARTKIRLCRYTQINGKEMDLFGDGCFVWETGNKPRWRICPKNEDGKFVIKTRNAKNFRSVDEVINFLAERWPEGRFSLLKAKLTADPQFSCGYIRYILMEYSPENPYDLDMTEEAISE